MSSLVAPDGTKHGDLIPGSNYRRRFCSKCGAPVACRRTDLDATFFRCGNCKIKKLPKQLLTNPTVAQIAFLRLWGIEAPSCATRKACMRMISYIKDGNGTVATSDAAERVALFQGVRKRWEEKRVTDRRHGATGTVICVMPRTPEEVMELAERHEKEEDEFHPFLARVTWDQRWRHGAKRHASVISFQHLSLGD